MISLLLHNNFYPAIHTDELERKRKRRIIVYGSVTRYGPRTSCQRKGLIVDIYYLVFTHLFTI